MGKNFSDVKQVEEFLQELKMICHRYNIKGVTGVILIGQSTAPFKYAMPSLLSPYQVHMYDSTYNAVVKACDKFGPPDYKIDK